MMLPGQNFFTKILYVFFTQLHDKAKAKTKEHIGVGEDVGDANCHTNQPGVSCIVLLLLGDESSVKV